MGLITGKVGLEAAKDADLIIEAVFETMAIKKEVFGKLDAIAKPGAILASNTSYLNIDEIASATKRPQDVLGMHFFSPANVMKLCEIVRGSKTAPDVLVTAVAISRRIAKIPAVVGNCDGFVGNRMLAARGKQSDKLLYEGALPQQIDAVVTKFGIPMGPFTMSDMAGLDIGWRSRKDRGIKSEIPDALCEAGRFGLKTGKGYYKYEGGRAPIPDPEVEDLIAKTLAKMGKKPRTVSDDEILERMVYPMVNEGARILEEKIAARPSDIDVVWLYGYGWPVYRGGPMHYADSVGLKKVAERLALLRQGDRRCVAGAGAASEEARRRGQDLRVARRGVKRRCPGCGKSTTRTASGGIVEIPAGTLPGLIERSAAKYGERTVIDFRDREMSFNDLAERIDVAAAAFLRAGYGKGTSVALFLGNTPDHPVNFFGATKAGARIVHLSPLDGEIALSHKLTDSGARVLVTSNLAPLLSACAEIPRQGPGRPHRRLRGRALGRDRKSAAADPAAQGDRHLRPVHRWRARRRQPGRR